MVGRRRRTRAPNRWRMPDTVFDGGWIVPGLVDAHCHVGLGATRPGRRPRRVHRAGRDRTRRRCAAAARLRVADRHPQPRRPPRPAAHHPARSAPGPAEALPARLRDRTGRRVATPRRGGRAGAMGRRLGQARRRLDRPRHRRPGAAVVRRRAQGGHGGGARQRRPRHRACVQRGCAAGPDQRGHRLHRARHRPHR